ncbi:MFS transporter [Paenibacillus sp. J2TS4]|uniref:MFS transporter n=1 Tax=Paenibacillus sp. J2TS4 TaxID=2807194 RepID=UPI001AFD1BC9|nr:MFS transporter [Paenibacillus sp. J2TS4]GIP31596.1 MFS metabolite transporter [Paenibacillus sp. J2TS4]
MAHPGETRQFFILKMFNFFIYATIAILFTFLPLYFKEMGLETIQIGMIMAGGPFISIIANPFWGYWSDRLQNIRRILVIMLLGNLIVIQAVFHWSGSGILVPAMIVFFFFQSPLFSQSNSLILNAIEGTSYRFGAFRLWGSLGWAVSAVAAGWLLQGIGLDRLGPVYSLLLICSLAFTFGLPRGNATAIGQIPNKGYRALFANKYFIAFLLLGVLISIPNSINSTFVSLYIAELGGTESMIGWSAFLSAAFEAPVFLLLDRYLKRNPVTMIACLVLVCLLFAIRWFLMSAVTGAGQIVLTQILHCVSFGSYYYIGTQLTAQMVPRELRATGQAAYALTWAGVSGIVAGVVGGWLFSAVGPRTMYGIGAGISLLGMIGFAILWRQMSKGAGKNVHKPLSA